MYSIWHIVYLFTECSISTTNAKYIWHLNNVIYITVIITIHANPSQKQSAFHKCSQNKRNFKTLAFYFCVDGNCFQIPQAYTHVHVVLMGPIKAMYHRSMMGILYILLGSSLWVLWFFFPITKNQHLQILIRPEWGNHKKQQLKTWCGCSVNIVMVLLNKHVLHVCNWLIVQFILSTTVIECTFRCQEFAEWQSQIKMFFLAPSIMFFFIVLFFSLRSWSVGVHNVQWIKYLTLPLSHKLFVVLFILFCFWSPGPQ